MFDEIFKIKEVTKGDKHYSISLENSCCFGLDIKYNYEPKVGDEIQLFTIKGSQIRGVFANGKKIFYKFDEQIEQERKEWLEKYEKEKQETFEKENPQLDRDYNALPKEFKARIDRFRKNNPRFRVDYEPYEIFCCKEAIKIAETCKTFKGVERFKKLNFNEQKEKAKISDEHSGNTFGCAVTLAYWYLKKKASVVKIRGSLSPLVGSKAFGDISEA